MLEWDDVKRRANRAKHGVDFAAAEAFEWEGAILAPDRRNDYGEPRFQVLGRIGARVHVLVYSPRGDALRIISLRKANAREVAVWLASNA